MQTRTKLYEIAGNLRKESTVSEQFLWKRLGNSQLEGFKFRRQQPIGKYIVDFVSFENKLILELDGGQHAITKNEDIQRDGWLRNRNYSAHCHSERSQPKADVVEES